MLKTIINKDSLNSQELDKELVESLPNSKISTIEKDKFLQKDA